MNKTLVDIFSFFSQAKPNALDKKGNVVYKELEKFQVYRQKIESLCHQMLLTLMDCNQGGVLAHDQIQDLEKIRQFLNSDAFRVAVVGDFSQGKSTLLNALLGEKIQPVRTIPCSGTVSVLKYGKQKRVICVYKNGKQENISLEQYQEKASIDKDIALDSASEGLKKNQIKEIIFEHPNLELCKNGVTFLDSPGLNEHPDRTAVTKQLLEDIDAIIFLTDASRPLTQGERELIQELKTSLNGGNSKQPAHNLFLVVNKWDLLDDEEEQERQDVKERIERICLGETALIAGENRIHFLSAQKVLKAIIEQSDSQHLDNFQYFTQSLETFLAKDRGLLKFQKVPNQIHNLVEVSIKQLGQTDQDFENKLNIYEAEKQKVIEQIGQVSGCDGRINKLASETSEQIKEKLHEALDNWGKENLKNRLTDKVIRWNSSHSMFWNQKAVIKDYQQQFFEDLKCEITNFEKNDLIPIIKENCLILDHHLKLEFDKIKTGIDGIDQQIKSNLTNELNITLGQIDTEFIFGGLKIGADVVGACVAGFLHLALAPLAWPVWSFFLVISVAGFGIDGFSRKHDKDKEIKLKKKIFEQGWKSFRKSLDPMKKKLDEIVFSTIDQRVEKADSIITEFISLYENMLEAQEKLYQETIEKRQTNKTMITQKSQELQQFSKQIEQLVNDF
ncbi:dynamin family protein [Crocosphaera sp. XPORK-15E]|uniref:dynamin family protein n=1 Tax=Crocosphaera sp. XPORK-15E TaxID=3110247 RepID=UPI002B1F2A1D|nr:dynamin family protein [Crocosphaera sp. XPORK-15E]MEA5535415.1 dynamin family protein [Crocosphaera sp. XPORK-15E]